MKIKIRDVTLARSKKEAKEEEEEEEEGRGKHPGKKGKKGKKKGGGSGSGAGGARGRNEIREQVEHELRVKKQQEALQKIRQLIALCESQFPNLENRIARLDEALSSMDDAVCFFFCAQVM
jgi:hypothetical protein